MYEITFKEIIKRMAIGLLIGLVLGGVLVFRLKLITDLGERVALTLAIAVLVGSIIAMVLCAKQNVQGFLSGTVQSIFGSVVNIFFSNVFAGSPILMALGVIKMFVGMIIMIPLGLYMAISFFLNIFYFGIMYILEKSHKLDGKAELCEKLDKIVPIVSVIIVVVICIKVFQM